MAAFMEKVTNRNGRRYLLIAEQLFAEVREGKYSAHHSFPSLTRIMRRFSVARATAAKSVEELKKRGVIVASSRSGLNVRAKNRTIGLIVPGVACTDFFQPIISEINQLSRKEGYQLLFAEVFSLDRDERIRQVRELAADFVKRRVAGVIYEPLAEPNGKEANDHILRVFKRAGIPVVFIDCDIVPFPQRSEYDVIGVNDVEAGAKIAAHLLSVGARKIHFLISGKLNVMTFENRRYGAAAELMRAGRFRKEYVLCAEADDLAALKRHLRKYGKPDAFICSNDARAAIFRQTLEKAGLSVPKDVMLTGFADLAVASLMTPPLTTVRQNRDKMGSAAFRRLLERIENPDLPANEILFPAPLIVRESTRQGKERLK